MTNLEWLYREHLKFSSIVTTYLIWNMYYELDGVSGDKLYEWLLEEREEQ